MVFGAAAFPAADGEPAPDGSASALEPAAASPLSDPLAGLAIANRSACAACFSLNSSSISTVCVCSRSTIASHSVRALVNSRSKDANSARLSRILRSVAASASIAVPSDSRCACSVNCALEKKLSPYTACAAPHHLLARLRVKVTRVVQQPGTA